MPSPKQHSILDELLEASPQPDADVFVSLIFDLAEQVKADMDAQGINRRVLAQRLGKSEPEISKWLSGLHNLTLQSVAKLSAALEVDLLTTRLNPQGHFGRLRPAAAFTELPAVVFANPPYASGPTKADMTRFTATSQTPEGEQQTIYEYAA